MNKIITIEYTNWKGETRIRRIEPISIWFGSTMYHRPHQWLMTAYDLEDCHRKKDFALKDMRVIDN